MKQRDKAVTSEDAAALSIQKKRKYHGIPLILPYIISAVCTLALYSVSCHCHHYALLYKMERKRRSYFMDMDNYGGQQGTDMGTLQPQPKSGFKSSFVNDVTELFYSAAKMAAQKNPADKRMTERNLETICRQIEALRDNELELISKKKVSQLRFPPSTIINTLDAVKDVITEEELQIYADKCRESDLIQRIVRNIAAEKKMHVTTYPGFDEKMKMVEEIASSLSGYIRSCCFGLEPGIYIDTIVKDYDGILA